LSAGLEELRKEFNKFFVPELISLESNPRVEIVECENCFEISIYENEQNATCTELKLRFPKNVDYIPFRVEMFGGYEIIKKLYSESKGRICEVALLIEDSNQKLHLLLVEMKSTLRVTQESFLKKVKNKVWSSLVFAMMLLKFFDYEPRNYYVIIGYKNKNLIEPTEFNMIEMDQNKRRISKEWEQKEWEFEWNWDQKLILKKIEAQCDSVLYWDTIVGGPENDNHNG